MVKSNNDPFFTFWKKFVNSDDSKRKGIIIFIVIVVGLAVLFFGLGLVYG